MPTSDSPRTRPSLVEQAESRKYISTILVDLVMVFLLLVPIVVCETVIEPFRRGFFCSDESLRYPFKGNTITPMMLGLIVGLPPFALFTIGEFARQYRKESLSKTRWVCGVQMPIWFTNTFKQFYYFVFGLLLTFDATEIGKYSIGRLRPHFMAVCQPQFEDGSTCADEFNKHRYVENYFCLGTGYTAKDIRQARLSFPSGHSSLAVYSMIYASLYLHKRIRFRRTDLTLLFLQFTLIMICWFTALSRIMDYWHHWSDVLGGTLIGSAAAILNANYVTKLFKNCEIIRPPVLTRYSTRATVTDVFTNGTLTDVLARTPQPTYTIPTSDGYSEQYSTKQLEQYSTKV